MLYIVDPPASPPAPGQLKALQAIYDAGGSLYPNLYKQLYTGRKQGFKLHTVIEMIAAIPKPIYDRNDKAFVSLAVRQIRKRHGSGGLNTWQKYLKAFVSWGLLEQYKPQDNINSMQAERNAIQYARIQAKNFKLSGENVNPTRWYHLPEYTSDLLMEADRRAGEYKASLTKADWILNAGQAEADRIYSDRRGISEKREATQEAIEKALTAYLYHDGYTTDKAIVAATEAATGYNRQYIENTLRCIRKDITERYTLQWCRPTKEQVTTYNLKGYAYIYSPEV